MANLPPPAPEKCGSASTKKEFRRLIGKIVEEDARCRHMPDYVATLESEDMVHFRNRGSVPAPSEDSAPIAIPHLKSETYERARCAASGRDV